MLQAGGEQNGRKELTECESEANPDKIDEVSTIRTRSINNNIKSK